jgi:type IV pilus assembly protein PilV
MKIHARALAHPVPRQPAAAVRGFTLLEVLVAIVVLSFGVLGVVGLQAAALSANKEARFQSTAVALGRELADLMRGNKDVAVDPDAADNPYLGNFTGALPTANPTCTPCASPTEVAQFHMRDWMTRVQAALPGYRVRVCFDTAPYAADNLPQWDCTAPPAGTPGMAYVKIGWTRSSAASAPGSSPDNARPAVILPLIAGR